MLSRVSFSWTVSCWIGGDDVEADGRGGVVMSVLAREGRGRFEKVSFPKSSKRLFNQKQQTNRKEKGARGASSIARPKGTLQRQEEPEFVSLLRQGC